MRLTTIYRSKSTLHYTKLDIMWYRNLPYIETIYLNNQ